MLVARPRLWDYANLAPACSHLDAMGHETGSALAAKLFTFFIQRGGENLILLFLSYSLYFLNVLLIYLEPS